MKAKVLCVSLVVAQGLWAMNVDRYNFYTRDYLDFGQNLGQFTPGAKNLSIVKKNGEVVALPDLPFPDFSKFSGANKTSVGGAYMASSKHIVHPQNKPVRDPNIKLGDSSYADQRVTTYATDAAYTRVNKFIVEGGYKITSLADLKKNAQDYMTNYQNKDRIILYRSGSGLMSFGDWIGNPRARESVKDPGVAGGLFYADLNRLTNQQLLIEANGNNYGPLRGAINTGDSGSPIFAFNTKTQEWELVGTAHGGTPSGQKVLNTFWSVVNPQELDKFKQRFEVKRQINDGQYHQERDKDSVYTESGTIVINDEVQQGMGGIILRGGVKRLTLQAMAPLAERG
ncbi:S6 family peptidase [Helicobacter zhangjianzhongii]|uniref:S6 family peptidase n=1 Tax=Helicobacter zhangjianzhongii TaxID=2974574 RepID=UPI0025568C39|nr:S6 family peptidase [Helicobacter sp. CPD2-1]MDL0080772.1 hypothetical protein [Helicobacter sp. CPD2-1]